MFTGNSYEISKQKTEDLELTQTHGRFFKIKKKIDMCLDVTRAHQIFMLEVQLDPLVILYLILSKILQTFLNLTV